MRGFWGIWHAGLSQLRKKTGITPTYEGEGTANTALVYHANKLMSLHEGDLPYAVSAIPMAAYSLGVPCYNLCCQSCLCSNAAALFTLLSA